MSVATTEASYRLSQFPLLVGRRPSPEHLLDRLSQVGLLRALPPQEVQALVPFVEHVEIPSGNTVFHQGEIGDALYIVEDGHALVRLDGGVEVARIGPGEVFGEIALLSGEPRTASLMAETNLSLWRLSKADFDRLVGASPQFEAALQRVAERHRAGLPLSPTDASTRRAWLGAALLALAAGGLTLTGLRAAEERVAAAIQRKRPSRDVNLLHDESLTFGQRMADQIASVMGSWPFILTQSALLSVWVVLNVTEVILKSWDPYPFILLNLMLSLQAAYAAPVIMMSQNRLAARDRLSAELDLRTNLHAETLIEELHTRVEDLRLRQWNELMALQERQIDDLQKILQNNQEAER